MISFILSFFKRKPSAKTSKMKMAKRHKASENKEEGPLDYPEYHYEYGFRPFWV